MDRNCISARKSIKFLLDSMPSDDSKFETQRERLKMQSSKIGIKVESILLNNVSGSDGVKSLNVEIKSNLLIGLPGISRYARRSISVPFISES